jgi:hypothetical protein
MEKLCLTRAALITRFVIHLVFLPSDLIICSLLSICFADTLHSGD